jgi:choloylglycine hydrolase
MVEKSERAIMAKSYDFSYGIGNLIVNKRNMKKVSLDGSFKLKALRWTSKYGNVTFNQAGIEFPYSGLNEKGVAIEVLLLFEARFNENSNNKKSINESQILQYILDMAENVDEAIELFKKVHIYQMAAGVHYFICDKTKECAVIEYLDGEINIYRGDNLPIKALSNTTYQKALDFYNSGDKPDQTNSSGRSKRRFNDVAKGSISEISDETIIEDSFKILNKVRTNIPNTFEITQWNIVYDLDNSKIYFNGKSGENTKSIDLKKLNFECHRRDNETIDMDFPTSGNINDHLTEYDYRAHKNLVYKLPAFGKLGRWYLSLYPYYYTRCKNY